MNGCLFVKRNWEKDQSRFIRYFDYLLAQGCPFQILVFPEGTILNSEKLERSNRYAKKQGMLPHQYTLHPKTTGFSFIAQHLQNQNCLDAIYDLTAAYPDLKPKSISAIITDGLPKKVQFQMKRIPAADIPKGEVCLKKWLIDIWEDKETKLKRFSTEKSLSRSFWQLSQKLYLRKYLFMFSCLTGWFLK